MIAAALARERSAARQCELASTLVVARVHQLTPAQMHRVVKWASCVPSMTVCPPTQVQFVNQQRPPGPSPPTVPNISFLVRQVLVDVSGGHQTALELRSALDACGSTGASVVEFTSEAMEHLYPDLVQHTALRNAHLVARSWGFLSHAWGFAAEALIVGLTGRSTDRAVRHIWVLEQDCDFAGPLSELIADYASTEADLVAKTLHDSATMSSWQWHDTATPAFLAAYGAHRCSAHIHAFRLSRRLLEALAVAANAGQIGWGEMSIPTLCIANGWRWEQLAPKHIGEPFTYDNNLAIVEPAKFELCERGRLYHPLKF